MQELIDGCMGDAAPYCQAACPMHTDVRGYVNLIAAGKFEEAIALIREKLFLPATLGRICPHPCEVSCKRGEIGAPMSIAALKRFVADNYDDPARWDRSIGGERSEHVAIIGSGPAGAQAAYDLRRGGYRVTIIDRLGVVGGMLRVGIPAYRLPRDIIDLEYSLLKELGVEFRMNTTVGKDVTLEELEREYDAIIVAIGAHAGVKLPVPGSDAEGVLDAVKLLRDVSLHGKTEGLGHKSVVIGGGCVAIDVARSIRRLDRRQVDLVCIERDDEEMMAHEWEVTEAAEEGVSISQGWGVASIESDGGRVSGITLKRCTQVFDADGKFAPEYDESDRRTIEADTVVFAIGQKIDADGFESLPRGPRGHFTADPVTLRVEGRPIFVAGDASGYSGVAIEAMAEGRKAARSVDRWLNGRDLYVDREHERGYTTKLETEVPEDAVRAPRAETRQRPAGERIGDFEEFDLGLEEAQALAEGARCLSCECRKCVKECLMLQQYAPTCPKHLFEKILAGEEIDPIVPYSCNMCSMCTVLCPKNYRIQDAFVEMRADLVKANKGKSPMKGHSVIYLHQKFGFSKLFNVTAPARSAPDDERAGSKRASQSDDAGAPPKTRVAEKIDE